MRAQRLPAAKQSETVIRAARAMSLTSYAAPQRREKPGNGTRSSGKDAASASQNASTPGMNGRSVDPTSMPAWESSVVICPR